MTGSVLVIMVKLVVVVILSIREYGLPNSTTISTPRLPSDKLKEFHACLSTVTQKQWCDVSQFVHSELRHVMRSSTGDGVMSSLGRRQEDRAQVYISMSAQYV